MIAGDLVTIARSPWNHHSIFGYKNGDIALILQLSPETDQISLSSVKVFILRTGRRVTVPTMYVKKIGE